jgi:hypothetical protein
MKPDRFAPAKAGSGLLPPHRSDAMLKRRRFKHSVSFHDRLAAFAKEAREKASCLPPGPEREAMLKKARQADTASQFDDWREALGPQSTS